MTQVTNTTELTEAQEQKIYTTIKNVFEQQYTDDFWHFSNEGNLLDLISFRPKVVFEIHSEVGSFEATIELNSKKLPLKNTIKFKKHE